MPASLVSVAVGIVLLALMAGAVVPSASSAQTRQLHAEAGKLRSLFDIAYRQSVQTGKRHAVSYDFASNTFEVYRADVSVDPPDNLQSMYHPVTKQPATWTVPAGVQLAPSPLPFQFGGGVAKSFVIFDTWGMPYAGTPGSHLGLLNGTLTLSRGESSVQLVVAPQSGRVTLQ